MQELTPRQKDVLHFINEYLENNGFPPTLQEIADKMKIQPSAARMHLLLMEKKKTLRYVPNTSRGIELLHRRAPGVPIYGSVPAGNPFFAEDNVVDTFEVPFDMPRDPEIRYTGEFAKLVGEVSHALREGHS